MDEGPVGGSYDNLQDKAQLEQVTPLISEQAGATEIGKQEVNPCEDITLMGEIFEQDMWITVEGPQPEEANGKEGETEKISARLLHELLIFSNAGLHNSEMINKY